MHGFSSQQRTFALFVTVARMFVIAWLMRSVLRYHLDSSNPLSGQSMRAYSDHPVQTTSPKRHPR